MSDEKWKDIPYEGIFYEVSNYGLVRNKATKKILKPNNIGSGYLQILDQLQRDVIKSIKTEVPIIRLASYFNVNPSTIRNVISR